MTPAGLSGSFGYRRELGEHPGVTLAVILTCAVGSVAGATLLLALPPGVFAAVAPWLILFTCLLVGAQPTISRWLRRRHAHQVAAPRTTMSRPTAFFAALTGVYGGYFGAGSGVMMVAVLGFGLDLDLRIVNALKTLAVLAANLVASIIFLVRRRPRLGGDPAARRRLRRRRLRRLPPRTPSPIGPAARADRDRRHHRRDRDAHLTRTDSRRTEGLTGCFSSRGSRELLRGGATRAAVRYGRAGPQLSGRARRSGSTPS